MGAKSLQQHPKLSPKDQFPPRVGTRANPSHVAPIPLPEPPPRKMPGTVAVANDSARISEFEAPSSHDSRHLLGRSAHVEAHRLVESDHEPPEFTACPVACLVPPLAQIAAVPPCVAWLDGEEQLRPSDVEMDRLTCGQGHGVLTDRFGESEPIELVEQRAFEVALGRPFALHGALQPALHGCHAVLAAAAMRFEVGRSILRRDEPQVPRILGGSLEPELVERCRQSEQRPQRGGHDHPVRAATAVDVEIEPSTAVDFDPARELLATASRHSHVDRLFGHLAQAVESGSGPSAQKAVPLESEMHRHATLLEALGGGCEADDLRHDLDEQAPPAGSSDRRSTEAELFDGLVDTEQAVLSAGEVEEFGCDHNRTSG